MCWARSEKSAPVESELQQLLEEILKELREQTQILHHLKRNFTIPLMLPPRDVHLK